MDIGAIDFTTITACGECCTNCQKKLSGTCRGCIDADGYVPEWADSGRCKVHACAREHKVQFCGICSEFPCQQLASIIHWNPDIVEHLKMLAGKYREQLPEEITSHVLSAAQLGFGNTRFWAYFLSTNYPCALLEETGESVADFVQGVLPVDMQWSDEFTQSYDGVFEETDGYLEDPTMLLEKIGNNELKIEFHPGDTIYYINGVQLGCTGPHWDLWKIPYQKVRDLLALPDGPVLFQLLLPMAALEPEEAADIRPILEEHFLKLGFAPPALSGLIGCVLSGIVKQAQ